MQKFIRFGWNETGKWIVKNSLAAVQEPEVILRTVLRNTLNELKVEQKLRDERSTHTHRMNPMKCERNDERESHNVCLCILHALHYYLWAVAPLVSQSHIIFSPTLRAWCIYRCIFVMLTVVATMTSSALPLLIEFRFVFHASMCARAYACT